MMDLHKKLENLFLFVEKHADNQAYCIAKLKKVFKKDNTKLIRTFYRTLVDLAYTTGIPECYSIDFEDVVNALSIYWQHLATEKEDEDLYNDFLNDLITHGEPTRAELLEYYEGFL